MPISKGIHINPPSGTKNRDDILKQMSGRRECDELRDECPLMRFAFA